MFNDLYLAGSLSNTNMCVCMFRIGNYPETSGEGEGGGFTFKIIHISKGNLLSQVLVIFYEFSLVKSVFCGLYSISSVLSDPIQSFNIFATNSSRVGGICMC